MTFTLFKLKRMGMLGCRNLLQHKLRSFLTALGIIFGVGSVISMLAIGEGASFAAREQIRQLGSTNVILRSRKPPDSVSGSQQTRRMSIYGLTYDDAHRIKVLFPQILVHVPARIMSVNIRRGALRMPGEVIGTIPWYLENTGLRVVRGRFIDEQDVDEVQNVCVLTEETARQFFPFTSPLGRTLFLGTQCYRVVGIVGRTQQLEQEEAQSTVNRVFIPISAARKRFGEVLMKHETGSTTMEKVELHQLTVTAPNEESVVPLTNAIRTMLSHFHREEDFEIVVPLELLKQAEETKKIFNIVLGSIAAISLLVGGIGIMNIMLANVTERTREIGIRRALGATRNDIVLQFLAEALLLSLAGGLLGIAVGVTIPTAVTRFAGLITIVQPDSLFLAFGIALTTGLVFGIYPAIRASALSPIEALRHE